MSLFIRSGTIYDPKLECGICLNNFITDPKASYHDEGGKMHPIHTDCFLKWVGQKPSCPTCSRKIMPLIFTKDEDPSVYAHIEPEAIICADTLRGNAKLGTDWIREDLSTIGKDIPDKEFREHTVKTAICLAKVNGHKETATLLENYLKTGKTPYCPSDNPKNNSSNFTQKALIITGVAITSFVLYRVFQKR